jgi:hypothetical protein
MKNEKLLELETKQAIEKHAFQVDHFKLQRIAESWKFAGKVLALSSIRRAINSQELLGLKLFQSEERYKDLGFDNFVEFLNSEHSPCTKSQYYERIKLLDSEGEQTFDLLNELGVSNSTRKLLASGNYDAITIENGILKIGEETADLSNAKLVRSLIESYADDCKKLTAKSAKDLEKIEKLEKTIENGRSDYEQLQRRIDADETPREKTFSKLVSSFNQFIGTLPNLDETESEKAEANLEMIWYLLEHSRKSLGSNKTFTSGDTSSLDPLVADVDFDDIDEE